MHHWASRTRSVIPCQPRSENVWRDFVTNQALEYDFLLHALFAVSAFHLAATEAEDRQIHKDLGMEHHSLSISLAQPALKDINTNNCHALFAFSCFTAIVSFATPHLTTPKALDPLKEVIDGFLLWRGISAVVESCFEAIAQGPMGTLFYLPDHKRPDHLAEDMKQSLQVLEERKDALDADDTAKQGYAGAIGQLYILFASCTGSHEEFNSETAVFGWPILVPREFIDTLWKSEPMALAILAHYAVMLHRISHAWWAASWGLALVEAVDDQLDESWEPCLRWPRQQVHSKSETDEQRPTS
jgi:Fungal specific transcription factor domain